MGNIHTGGYWSTIENQKKFFDKFAQERGLDPLNSNDWCNVTVADIRNAKVFSCLQCLATFLSLYMHLFPHMSIYVVVTERFGSLNPSD